MLSIDPSSPFTKGALLGDRIRLTDHFLDPGVFIRSMANRGALGGLSEATLQAALLMDASGRDVVLLETVGVGQAEVDIIDHADTVVLVLMPGSGDSIQALKAGVMEIPDVIVVNKADHPLTDTMVREIKGVLALGPHGDWQVPIVRTEARDGRGRRGAARTSSTEHRAHIEAEGTLSERRRRNLMNEVLGIATFRMRRELEASIAEDPEVQELLDRVVSRELDPASAAGIILERAANGPRMPGAGVRGGCPDRSVRSRGARAGRRRGGEAARAGARGPGAARARPARGGHRRFGRSRCGEVALGVWALVSPGAVAAIGLACCYAVFAMLALLLASRRAACGCFGEGDFPASPVQALLSAVLAAACAFAAGWPPHGLLDRPAGQAVVLVIGIAGSAYAMVLAYTQLPAAWSAWSAR